MRSLLTILIATSVLVGVVYCGGAVVGAAWLIYLGLWKPVLISLLLLFTWPLFTGIAVMPGAILAIPGITALRNGRNALSAWLLLLPYVYVAAVMSSWAWVILQGYTAMGPSSAKWPLMLLSCGAATGPWMYLASQESKDKEIIYSDSSLLAISLLLGYSIASVGRVAYNVSPYSCFWIIAASMVPGIAVHLFCAAPEIQRKMNRID